MAAVRHLEFAKIAVLVTWSACDPSFLFQISRWSPRYSQKRFSIWRPSAILNLKNFDRLSNLHAQNGNLYLCTKFHRNRLIHGCDKAIFKMAAVRHLEFAKIAILVTWPISACDRSFLFQISRWSANIAPRYCQKTIFNMASVRHLEFEKFQFFVKLACSEWKFVSVNQIWSKSDNSWLRYGDKAIFKMASVRHVGFVMTSSYCIRKLHFTFPTLC